MYKQIMLEIKTKQKEIQEQISELQNKVKSYDDAYKAIEKLQGQYEREHNNLAVQKKICPFPDSCNQRYICTLDKSCEADECSNGYAFRRS